MSASADRRYMSTAGFSDLARTLKDSKSLDRSKIAICSNMPVEVKAVGDGDTRLIEFIITTDTIDREQDVVSADGWDFEDFQNNPVVLWCHDHYAPVIGNSRSLTPGGNQVRSICEFTPQDLNPFGYMIYRLYAQKFMHAVSVGFYPIEYTMAADRKWGVNYIQQGLLEYSCVPVPANPDALAVARSKGIDTAPMRDWASRVLDEQPGLSEDARRRMEILRAVSAPSGRALILEVGALKMTGPETKTPPAVVSPIKRIERWECGSDGHVHVTEAEAKSCSEFDLAVTDVTRSLQSLQGLVKGGRTIGTDAGTLLRSIVEALVPPVVATPKKEDAPKEEPAKEESGVLETEEPEGLELNISEDQLRAVVTAAVSAELNKVTGRVD